MNNKLKRLIKSKASIDVTRILLQLYASMMCLEGKRNVDKMVATTMKKR